MSRRNTLITWMNTPNYIKGYWRFCYIVNVDGVETEVQYRTFKTYKEVLRKVYNDNPTITKAWIVETFKEYIDLQ